MALTYSAAHPANSRMPEAPLTSVDGRTLSLSSLTGAKGTLIAITCNHCPYAQAVWPRVVRLAREIRPMGVATVAVNPNMNPAYPEDSLEGMARAIERWEIDFPYLADTDQSFAKALGALCTPEFFLYDAERVLRYHGRLDDCWQDESRVSRRELYEAVVAMVQGRPIPDDQKPAMGCSIKWV